MSTQTVDRTDYELRFRSLHDAGRAMAFPCDARGRVDMDSLGRAALNNYLYARAFIGREFDTPCILNVDRAPGHGPCARQEPPWSPASDSSAECPLGA